MDVPQTKTLCGEKDTSKIFFTWCSLAFGVELIEVDEEEVEDELDNRAPSKVIWHTQHCKHSYKEYKFYFQSYMCLIWEITQQINIVRSLRFTKLLAKGGSLDFSSKVIGCLFFWIFVYEDSKKKLEIGKTNSTFKVKLLILNFKGADCQ